jgi:transcription elongation GreA/GreB family factor
MNISTIDIRQRLNDAIETAGPVRAADRALLEQLMEGVSGPTGALVHQDVVGFGSEVTLEDLDTGERVTHRLMSADAMDLDAGHVSTESPIGRALLGRASGDVVEFATPRGTRRVRVVGVETLPAYLDTLGGPSRDGSSRRATDARWRTPREPHTGTYG